MIRHFVFYLAIFLPCLGLFAQTVSNKDFDKFISNNRTAFEKAYEKRDVTTYEHLMTDLLAQYNKLTQQEKKKYTEDISGAYYNLACTYSLTNNKEKALNNLEKSIKAGWFKYSHIQRDTDLDNIRKEPGFNTIIEPIRNLGDFLYILRRASTFNDNDTRSLPSFTYQPSTNPKLVALRKGFNLDSIAGTAGEINQMLNLMHWLHNLVPHAGDKGIPEIRNAMHLLSVCKKEKRGLNCRGLSTVLNECYLAMGFKSRLITCLPKDSLKVDQDCHVINMVWSNTLKKWLWLDATHDAYVMNEKGEMLSVEEVRERLINNQTVIVNPSANWNNKNTTTKEDYLFEYMAKNLYMMECATSSEYNLETGEDGKAVTYIRLLPMEYYDQKEDRTETKGKKNKYTTINTNNPAKFWAAPQ
jgi:hypothetical protein